MSDLLNSASLVMVPSGYKEDTVYSVVPSDGSGDLSFTRASNGTRINSAGLVEVCPWNLLEQSQSFSTSGGAWNFTAGSGVTTGQTGYDGTTNAVLFTDSGANAVYGAYQSFNKLGAVTLSIYAKAGSTNIFNIDIFQTPLATVRVNLSTGAITSGSGTVESVGNGWYRISVTAVMTDTYYVRFGCPATGTVYIQNIQANIGSTAKPYFPTTDRLNVPRLTYQNGGGGCPSLLLEKQSTNISTQSTVTSFGSGANEWLNGAGTPAAINQTTGIDGTQNGAKYTRTAGQTTDDFFYKNDVPITSGTTYTVSGYIKLGTASNAVIVINNAAAWNSVPNGSIVCSTANGFSTTAWKRFELTITGPSTNKINVHYGYHQETGVAAQADGTFFFDGLQIEASSYATSLIPTTSSSATRVADACFKTGISSLIGQTEGVMFVDFVVNGFEDYGTPLGLNDGTINNYIWFTTFANGNIRVEAYSGGAVQAQIVMSGGVVGQRYKMAFAYKTNDFVLYINGTQIGTDSSGSVPPNLSRVDFDLVGAWAQQSLKINQVALFKTRLTNAELASLTTI